MPSLKSLYATLNSSGLWLISPPLSVHENGSRPYKSKTGGNKIHNVLTCEKRDLSIQNIIYLSIFRLLMTLTLSREQYKVYQNIHCQFKTNRKHNYGTVKFS